MTSPQIVGNRKPVSASSVLEAIGADLMQIKHEDRLTFVDIGRVLGKSEDQAARYCDGTAEMGVTAYHFAKQVWNGRFTGRVDALIAGHPDNTCDRTKESRVLKAALALSVALADGKVDVAEIHENRSTIEAAIESLQGLLSRIGPQDLRA